MMLQPAFLQVWNEPSFLALLRRAATDAALQALSASAEFALQSDDNKSCDYAPGTKFGTSEIPWRSQISAAVGDHTLESGASASSALFAVAA